MKQFRLGSAIGYIHTIIGAVCFRGVTINLMDAMKMKSTLGAAIRAKMGV